MPMTAEHLQDIGRVRTALGSQTAVWSLAFWLIFDAGEAADTITILDIGPRGGIYN
jgi:hypothetical protein